MDDIAISVGGSSPVWRNRRTFQTWFPDCDSWNARGSLVDVGDIVDYIKRELRKFGIYISDTDIKQAWGDLMNALSSRNVYDFGGTCESQVTKMMANRLVQDVGTRGNQGLYRSRSRFLTLCFVAHRTSSVRLARSLLQFFNDEEVEIVESEDMFLLTEWCLGLRKLQGLVSEDKLHQAMSQVASLGPPMFEEWRRLGPHHSWIAEVAQVVQEMQHKFRHDPLRGRDRLQLSAPCDWPIRRLSAPPRVRPRRPMLQIEMPTFSRTGYNTPLLSPRRLSTADEVNALQWRQQEHSSELDRLRRDVDSMKYRY
jgi:hypothetical protein